MNRYKRARPCSSLQDSISSVFKSLLTSLTETLNPGNSIPPSRLFSYILPLLPLLSDPTHKAYETFLKEIAVEEVQQILEEEARKWKVRMLESLICEGSNQKQRTELPTPEVNQEPPARDVSKNGIRENRKILLQERIARSISSTSLLVSPPPLDSLDERCTAARNLKQELEDTRGKIAGNYKRIFDVQERRNTMEKLLINNPNN